MIITSEEIKSKAQISPQKLIYIFKRSYQIKKRILKIMLLICRTYFLSKQPILNLRETKLILFNKILI